MHDAAIKRFMLTFLTCLKRDYIISFYWCWSSVRTDGRRPYSTGSFIYITFDIISIYSKEFARCEILNEDSILTLRNKDKLLLFTRRSLAISIGSTGCQASNIFFVNRFNSINRGAFLVRWDQFKFLPWTNP